MFFPHMTKEKFFMADLGWKTSKDNGTVVQPLDSLQKKNFLQPLDSFVSASTASFVKIFKNFNLEKSFMLPLKCL